MPHRFDLHSPPALPLSLNLLLDRLLASLQLHIQLGEEGQQVFASQGVGEGVEPIRVIPDKIHLTIWRLSLPLVAGAQVGLTHLVRLLLLVLHHRVTGNGVLVPDDLHLVMADTLRHVVVLPTPSPKHI